MKRIAAVFLVVIATAAQAQNIKSSGTVTSDDRVRTLARLWQEVNYNFAYFDHVPDLDWDARFVAYLPEVTAASNTFAFYRVLQRFMAELHDGHTLIFFPDSIVKRRPIDVPWVELEEVAHHAIVANVDSALSSTLPIGSEILQVDEIPVTDYLQRYVFPLMAVSTEHVLWRDGIRGKIPQMYGLLSGPAGSQVRIGARTPAGKMIQVGLTRDRATRSAHWALERKPRPLLEFRSLKNGVAYVAINSFNDQALVPQFDSIMPHLMRSKGIVIDVRRNGGGVDDVVKQILVRLTADTLLGPAWRTRIHNATFKAWGRFADEGAWAEQYRPYWQKEGVWQVSPPDTVLPTGRGHVTAAIVVLTSSETASAAENFLIYIHRRKRFTLIGQPTSGSSGQPLMMDLPGGGRAWICTKRNTYPDGTTYIGTGVMPDISVAITVEDVRAGRDRALEKAIEFLQQHE